MGVHKLYQLTDGQRERLKRYAISGARNFQHFLSNKVFYVICEDGMSIEVRFFAKDFQHLTGILSDLSEKDFYEHCRSGKLDKGNIKTAQKYNWATLRGKGVRVEKVHELLYKDGNKTLLLECLKTNTAIFPCAIRNDSNDICIGFVGGILKARSLRKASNSMDAGETKKIMAIFAKRPESVCYDELVYISNVLNTYEKDEALIEKIEEPLLSKFLEIVTRP